MKLSVPPLHITMRVHRHMVARASLAPPDCVDLPLIIGMYATLDGLDQSSMHYETGPKPPALLGESADQ